MTLLLLIVLGRTIFIDERLLSSCAAEAMDDRSRDSLVHHESQDFIWTPI